MAYYSQNYAGIFYIGSALLIIKFITIIEEMNGYFDSIWLPQFHHHSSPITFQIIKSRIMSYPPLHAFTNVYSLECRAASGTPLCLVVQQNWDDQKG